MDLTQEQVEAAQASGYAFFPATEAQIAVLSMQRRIFRIEGRPLVAARDGGGFMETRGTLLPLIEGHRRGVEPGKQETVQEAAAADAASEREIAGERGAGRAGGPAPPGRSAAGHAAGLNGLEGGEGRLRGRRSAARKRRPKVPNGSAARASQRRCSASACPALPPRPVRM